MIRRETGSFVTKIIEGGATFFRPARLLRSRTVVQCFFGGRRSSYRQGAAGNALAKIARSAKYALAGPGCKNAAGRGPVTNAVNASRFVCNHPSAAGASITITVCSGETAETQGCI